jgi:hypothetical protein
MIKLKRKTSKGNTKKRKEMFREENSKIINLNIRIYNKMNTSKMNTSLNQSINMKTSMRISSRKSMTKRKSKEL